VTSRSDSALEPGTDCPLCPRLAEFRNQNRHEFADWHNAPVPSFGSLDAPLLIVGLAPGKRGANRTGRPFTGDYAGDLLYPTLVEFGLAVGPYGANPNDGLVLQGCRITNAVRCVPPQNKPTGPEIKACRGFLAAEITAMANLKGILALGGVAHNAVLVTLGWKRAAFRFGHGARHENGAAPWLIDSYHCSRLNTNTGRLTTDMFREVIAEVRRNLPIDR
jgi:uracil-DNA glycosylase family 4